MNKNLSAVSPWAMAAFFLVAQALQADQPVTPDIELNRATGPIILAQAQTLTISGEIQGQAHAEEKPAATLSEAQASSVTGNAAQTQTSPTNDTPELVPLPTTGSIAKENLISVSLDDVPLQDVVRMFTRISGANIIATSTNLQGKVTVNLQDVEWKPALSSILDMYNLTVFEKIPGSGIYSVIAKPAGAAEPLVAQTIFLNFASVSNVMSIVQAMVDKGGSVAPFPNANALIVRTSAANLNEIRKVVREIDLPRKQVYIEAKFLELTDEAIKDLGINWQVLEGYGVGVKDMEWGIQESRDKVKKRSDTLTRTDKRTKSDTLNNEYDNSGAPFVTEEPTPTRIVNDTIDQGSDAKRYTEDSFTKTVTDIRTAVLSADDFAIILSALKQMNGVSIVSNPKIVVANEETATIHIGENEPNIKGTVTAGQQGQANTTTYALDEDRPYFEFGISVDVTPTINNDSNITVRINPKLSRFVRDKVAPDNNTFPVEATKTIKTVFSLESGKTAAIGGLTETDERDVTKKIPLLGDIPLIGKYLFSHTHKQSSQKETIIFVTVAMANPGSIQRDEGLPENSKLVHQILKASDLAKEQKQSDAQ